MLYVTSYVKHNYFATCPTSLKSNQPSPSSPVTKSEKTARNTARYSKRVFAMALPGVMQSATSRSLSPASQSGSLPHTRTRCSPPCRAGTYSSARNRQRTTSYCSADCTRRQKTAAYRRRSPRNDSIPQHNDAPHPQRSLPAERAGREAHYRRPGAVDPHESAAGSCSRQALR